VRNWSWYTRLKRTCLLWLPIASTKHSAQRLSPETLHKVAGEHPFRLLYINSYYKWMRPVPAASLDPTSLHGLAFKIKLKGGETDTFCLIPYEFAEGKSPVAEDDKKALGCITQLANYIIRRGLADVFALQFIEHDDIATPTAEVKVHGLGTITLPQSMQKIGTLVPVSWPNPADPTVYPEGPGPSENWNVSTKPDGTKTHKVHVGSLQTEEGVLGSLAEAGIFLPDGNTKEI